MNYTRINSQLCATSRFRLNCPTQLRLADQRRQRSVLTGAASALAVYRKSALKPDAWLRSRFDMTRKQMESPDISLSSFTEDCLNRNAAVAKRNPPTRSRCHFTTGKTVRASHPPRAPDTSWKSLGTGPSDDSFTRAKKQSTRQENPSDSLAGQMCIPVYLIGTQ